MTDEGAAGSADGEVAGGLEDPGSLQPEQGGLALADPEHDDHDRTDWEAAAAAVLRKAKRLRDDDPDDAVWARLTRTTLDGIGVGPLGTPEAVTDLTTAGRPTRSGDWDIRSFTDRAALVDDPRAAHEHLLADLAGGVNSLWLQAGPSTDWARLLEEVLLDLAPVVLEPAPGEALATARAFLDHVGDADLAAGTQLGAGPDDEDLVDVARLAAERGVLGLVVDGTRTHDRGASDAQELGWVLAAGVRALRRLEDAGIEPAQAAGLVELRLAVTDEQLTAIAKLRAARRAWARVLGASGVEDAPVRVHAVTSRPMMSRYDPHVNMLRTTVAAFAAGVGGAEAVTVLPFDAPLGRPEAFGRRIARNTSALLISESHVAKVVDPAGGSYAVERLTDDLAVAAWAELGRIEAEGHDPAAYDARVAEVVAERDRQVATRERPLTGLSEFPSLSLEQPERAPYDAWDAVRPWGAAYEAMRDDPPARTVFLATLGPIAAHTARATFATNLLAAGGVGVDVAGPTEGPDDLVAAYGGQPVVCLAGADGTYDEWGERAAAALREAGASYVVVAGRPRDWADDDAAMGVDAVEFLGRVREKLS
ncbi:methylmalonyl-CoA mutase family protein [Nocardioides sp. CFH 31398]|uniref:methylmalonyl-CoA mutase family protein n=1 Tax=Nocardioides sp. CFH 31398 TaxID=2919579 RepID=UPI001F065554|nr:methylmalonyl-CoA mutase family protein [Nocardioides sp. CFH 31398]MCH1866335.1 methylmalonyl-CoA mutase family protein [Nocardioides sp. CFH 31398]